jgi:hypothetical protein
MPPLPPQDSFEARGRAIVAKFLRLAELRGFIEVRPSEVKALAIDLGYRTSSWSTGDWDNWLASHLAAAGVHPSVPELFYRSGLPVPGSVGPEYLARTLNRLVRSGCR